MYMFDHNNFSFIISILEFERSIDEEGKEDKYLQKREQNISLFLKIAI